MLTVSRRMIVVVFALPQESRDFRRTLGAERCGPGEWTAKLAGRSLRILHCGVGPVAASGFAARLLAGPLPSLVIGTGFAGALAVDLALGDGIIAANLSEPRLLALAQRRVPALRGGVLLSLSEPAESVAAKRELAARDAMAVDMESAALAAACGVVGVPFLALRVISDCADEPLPVPFAVWFDVARQRPRVGCLLGWLACHPAQVGPFVRFVRGLAPARRRLGQILQEVLPDLADAVAES